MGRPRSPMTIIVDQAIQTTVQSGVLVTPDNVRARLNRSAIGGLPVTFLLDAVEQETQSRVADRLKSMGWIITNAATRERKPFSDATAQDLAQREFIQTLNIDYVRVQQKATRIVRKYLEKRSKALGRPVTVSDFPDEVRNIYARLGVTPPGPAA
jgi:hypothetical protein